MSISRRALLGATAIAALAACTSTTGASSDLQLVASGLAALIPVLPASATSAVQQAQAVLQAVQSALASNPTLTTIQQIGSLIADLAPAVIGLFPGGGTAVAIVNAIVALLPEIETAFGGASMAAKFGAKKVQVVTTPADARAFLRTLLRAQ